MVLAFGPALRQRLRAVAALGAAALLLAACFVTSQYPVDGSGADADPQLVGAWRGLDEDGSVEPGVFLHALRQKDGEGLAMVLVDKDSLMVMDATTVQAGPHRYLNVTLKDLGRKPAEDPALLGVHIVKYDVKGNGLSLWLLDPKAIVEAVEDGKIKGTIEGTGATRSARLTASSEELNAFLARPDAATSFQTSSARLVRFLK